MCVAAADELSLEASAGALEASIAQGELADAAASLQFLQVCVCVLCICPLTHSFVCSFTHLFIHLFIYPYTHHYCSACSSMKMQHIQLFWRQQIWRADAWFLACSCSVAVRVCVLHKLQTTSALLFVNIKFPARRLLLCHTYSIIRSHPHVLSIPWRRKPCLSSAEQVAFCWPPKTCPCCSFLPFYH